ncbi:MAG TPA: hypothetical protein VHY09_15605, partial [Candidatus Methylacidiphilales bacterium]|nr:hypothetical protein [Candidatus Methylacidiphilales bacterium]
METQPVAELRFGLRIAQAIEVLEQHDLQHHRRPVARSAQLAVGGLQPPLGLPEINPRIDLFEHFIGPCPLRQRPIPKTRLLILRWLHSFSTLRTRLAFNHFAEISGGIKTG